MFLHLVVIHLTRRSTSWKQYDGRELGNPHSANRILLLIPDLGERNSILKIDGETLPQSTSRAFTCKQDGLGSVVFLAEEVNPVGGSEFGNVVRDTLGDGVGYGLGGAGALVFYSLVNFSSAGRRRLCRPSTVGFPFFSEGRKVLSVGKPCTPN